MTNIHTLTVLLGRNESQRDTAIAEHLRAVAHRQAASAQAEQLRAYRHEYEQRWSAQFAVEGRIELVHCYHGFMARLTQALEHQLRVETHAESQVERALGLLHESELRCASVRKLIERRSLEQRLADERRDQKQTDEFAARVAWNRQGTGGQPGLS
ncbi:MAG: flagellar export protein FliJ [Bacteriovorax sp.]|nr:flagellar export protein FliJ [Rhizobacter sp.]